MRSGYPSASRFKLEHTLWLNFVSIMINLEASRAYRLRALVNFCFTELSLTAWWKQEYRDLVSSHQRGGSRSSRNAGRDAVDARCTQDEGADCGRLRRVVLISRRWIKSAEAIPPATVAKEPVHRPEHAIRVKTIAQGRPDQFGEPVVIMLVCFIISHARLRVHWAPGFPCAL